MTRTETTVPVEAVAIEHLTHRYPAVKQRRQQREQVATPSPSSSSSPEQSSTQAGVTVHDRPALTDVSFHIRQGEIFGILGPNGGGKTTMFRILATLLRQTSGRVQIFGHDVQTSPATARQMLGVVFQNPSIDMKLTARENLHHHGRLYGLGGNDLKQRIEHWLERFGMLSRADDLVEQFSGGMRRRVELAKAMLPQPQLLLLDEPSTGLDPGARRDLWDQITALRNESRITVALTTHLMDEADKCDRLAVLSQGQLVASDTPAQLKSRIGGQVVTITPADDAQMLRQMITDRYGPFAPGGEPMVIDGRVRLERQNGTAFLATLSTDLPGHIQALAVGQPTLEDIFLHLTGHTLWDEPPVQTAS